MKLTTITYIIIILLAFGCDRYDELSDTQQQNFTKYYGIGLEDEGISVIETSEGYVVMANVDNGNNRQDIALIRTNTYGNTLGPITMIGGEYEDAGNVIKEIDDGFIIAGYTRPETEVDDKDPLIVKVNSNGEVVWQKTYGYDVADDEVFDLVVKESGDIALAGYTEYDTTRNGDINLNDNMLLLELTSQGNLLSMAWAGYSNYDETANSIVAVGSTYYLGGAKVGAYNNSEVTSYAYAVQWSGGYSISLPQEINTEPGMNAEIVSMVLTEADELYLACNLWPVARTSFKMAILKLANGLDKNPDEKIDIGMDQYGYLSSMKYINNTIWVNGTTATKSSGAQTPGSLVGNMFLASLSANGQINYHYFGDGASYTGKGFDISSVSEGYVLTGAAFINDQSSIVLTKSAE